jgi:thiol-disulfide isomerase/thioredoxin
MKAQRVILIFSLAMLASFAGAFAYRYVYLQPWEGAGSGVAGASPGSPGGVLADSLIGSPRPDFLLGSSTGEQVSASFFDGEVTLVNFWATWCKPCREEMPMLLGLHKAYEPSGFKVVGVAIDDVQQAREFAAGLGVDYPILVGSTDVMVMARSYGNLSGVLPYSVLIDRAGIVRWTNLGELKEKELARRIKELLATGS